MFSFEHNIYLLILIILPILTGLFLFFQYQRKRTLRQLGNPELLMTLMPDYSRFRKVLKFFLMVVSLGLIIAAIAGPRFGSKLSEFKHEGIDLIIALDISNSMLAEDIKPNRLERAKQELARLLDRLENDRIGLIVFAGDAYTQIPITNDYLSAKMFLASINTEMISKQGTAIGSAIELAIRSFNPRSNAGKAIVIISDGENHEGEVLEACQKATEKGIKIFTIGMGQPQGVRIPMNSGPYNRDFRRDAEGNFVITRLSEPMLMEIASAGNGKYYRASMPDMGLSSMIDQFNRMKQGETDFQVYTEFNEQFPVFIWLAFGLLVLEFLLLERRNRWLKNIRIFGKK